MITVFQIDTMPRDYRIRILRGRLVGGRTENSYFARPAALGTMSLINWLFPKLSQYFGEGLPSFVDPDEPWKILSHSPEGIIAQISELVGDGGTFIHPSAVIGDFVEIEEGCYIGPRAEIRHCAYLRRGTWVCEGAMVGHSTEVKNSLLLPLSKAPHFNYVGDSILGIDVNLGAGTKLSNVRNDRGEIVVHLKDGSRSETGLSKLGALVGDGSQLGCNVVTNPGSIISPGSMINPNATVRGFYEN